MTTRRLAIAATPFFLPWTVLVVPDQDVFGIELVFAWGLLDPNTLHVVTLADYLFEYTAGLPAYLLAWPTSVLLYALAVASLVGGVALGREDRRLTAGLLVLAGLSHLRFSTGIGMRGDRIALPIAAVLLWLLAWRNRPTSWFPQPSRSRDS